MTANEFKALALSFPGTIEKPHFDRTAFKVINKRIFATLHEESKSANIVLPLKDQDVFCAINKEFQIKKEMISGYRNNKTVPRLMVSLPFVFLKSI
ncbi:MAG: MmcQ/YjbR family DNA-binding protein [Ginsengibacter sp.]